MRMTSKKLSSILAQWRHCRAAAGCGITVIRWRGPGFTGLVASVVRDPPCSEHPARVSTVRERNYRQTIEIQNTVTVPLEQSYR